MEPGPMGVFSYLDTLAGGEAAEFARKVESLGYGTLWFPETFGRDPFVTASYVLSNTTRIATGTGIAVVWKRDPSAMVGAARTIGEPYRRFVAATSFLPGAALLSGRQRWTSADMPWRAIAIGAAVTIVLVALHPMLFGGHPLG